MCKLLHRLLDFKDDERFSCPERLFSDGFEIYTEHYYNKYPYKPLVRSDLAPDHNNAEMFSNLVLCVVLPLLGSW